MATATSGYQPRNTPAERRAFFDLERKMAGFVSKSGDTMTGPLILPGSPDPATDSDEAITADYLHRWLNLIQAPVPWIALPGQPGWANYGGAYAQAAYRKVGDMVQVRGHITSASTPLNIAQLPVGYRPPAAMQFMGWGSANAGAVRMAVRLDITIGGMVQLVTTPYSYPSGAGTPTAWDHISLNDISFSVTP